VIWWIPVRGGCAPVAAVLTALGAKRSSRPRRPVPQRKRGLPLPAIRGVATRAAARDRARRVERAAGTHVASDERHFDVAFRVVTPEPPHTWTPAPCVQHRPRLPQAGTEQRRCQSDAPRKRGLVARGREGVRRVGPARAATRDALPHPACGMASALTSPTPSADKPQEAQKFSSGRLR